MGTAARMVERAAEGSWGGGGEHLGSWAHSTEVVGVGKALWGVWDDVLQVDAEVGLHSAGARPAESIECARTGTASLVQSSNMSSSCVLLARAEGHQKAVFSKSSFWPGSHKHVMFRSRLCTSHAPHNNVLLCVTNEQDCTQDCTRSLTLQEDVDGDGRTWASA